MPSTDLIARVRAAVFGQPPPVVAVVRLSGPIGRLGPFRQGLTLGTVAGPLARAFRLPGVRAVALEINSPGGSPVQSALIHKRVRALAEEHDLPVIAFVEDVGASGGYWLACAADEIYADDSSVVGSIGVIAAGFGFDRLLERFGIERRVHAAGAHKGMLDPFRPEEPAHVARLGAIQADIHEAFKTMVRARRAGKLKGSEEDLFSGSFWTGREAETLGLIDGLGDIRGVLRRRYGDEVRFRGIGPRPPLLRRWLQPGSSGRPGTADAVAGLVAAVEERALWSRYGL